MPMSFRSLPGTARPFALAALSLAVAGALALPQGAHASAFQLKENSAKGMGRAYAGSATAGGDASVVANNPAAMTDLDGTYLQADITAINFSAKFSGTAHDALGRPISGGNGGDAGTTLPVPALFIASKVSDRVHLGFGLSVPFGFQTEYDSNWMGRYNAIKSRFESLDATLSGSFDVNDQFSLGASVIAQKTSAELTSAINFNGVALGLIQQGAAAGAIPPAAVPTYLAQVGAVVPPGSDGLARIKGDDWGYGWQVGAYWKLTPNDKLAFDYRSKISHKLQGTGNFTVPGNVSALLSSPQIAPLLAGLGGVPFTHTTGTANFTTPATAGLSYWHQAEKFGLGIDLNWTKWDVFKELRVQYGNPAQPDSVEPFNWRNTWYAAIGGDYYVNDKLTLRAGISVDTTPTYNATRDARVPDSTRKFAALGLGYKASENFEINASYAHIFVNRAHVNSASPTGDVLAGNFDDYGNLLSLSAQYKF
ncbi:OmpP1/FadL family transporter [Frateuria terrea]|uniref:Long-chain fatty acid transport protein n=1 Tax=Frateuria terrea TaxID=529704 RepID=A0A1H6WWP4_9GAMM|nr:outer membrane protein transport protein [Frateuria terrea]SEJ21258.1 long-chain fatty acid transport protein [Frateuria terrea]SFP58174.1 long-chain fatty acid transport protein [Frateuria terrea]